MNTLVVSKELQQVLPGGGEFDALMEWEGETIRLVKDRHTLRAELGEKAYFIKRHRGIGYREALKELLTLKVPVFGARNEYEAICHFQKLGLPTMEAAAFGERGLNPVTRHSCIATHEISDTLTLKEVTEPWRDESPAPLVKRALLRELAAVARTMHEGGVNHRDFYLCHFRIKRDRVEQLGRVKPEFYVMDLHRAQIRSRVPMRWRVKDIGALYFSAAHLPVSRWDLLRFMRYYSGKPLRQTLEEDRFFWKRVVKRAQKFYHREWGQEMPLLLPPRRTG